MSYQILGYGYTWWRGDPLPALAPLPGFRVVATNQYSLIAELAQLAVDETQRRVHGDHQPYIAYLDGQPVAYGWSAAREGAIQELELEFAIPAHNRYLWDFATLPAWRGRGVYPRLLQAVLQLEAAMVDRFWIGHTADNMASRRGIIKAGFQQVEALVASPTGHLHIMAMGPSACAEVSPMGLRLGVIERTSDRAR
jgi:GNAT superfamily N-acetyltransferase